VSDGEITALQTERLKWSLNHAYQNVVHYHEKFDAVGALG
jgi:phenylacetate-CoA ligase